MDYEMMVKEAYEEIMGFDKEAEETEDKKKKRKEMLKRIGGKAALYTASIPAAAGLDTLISRKRRKEIGSSNLYKESFKHMATKTVPKVFAIDLATDIISDRVKAKKEREKAEKAALNYELDFEKEAAGYKEGLPTLGRKLDYDGKADLAVNLARSAGVNADLSQRKSIKEIKALLLGPSERRDSLLSDSYRRGMKSRHERDLARLSRLKRLEKYV